MNKERSLDLLTRSFKEMIAHNPLKKAPDNFSISKLFGRFDLTQSQKIQLGLRIEEWINHILNNHKGVKSKKPKNSKLWIDLKSNNVIEGGNGSGFKDVDILFIKDGTTYYLESKNNLNLDTEKGPETIEKVKLITKSLRKNGDYSNVIGKVISAFWDETNVPVSGSMKNSGAIMWFSEFCSLLGLDITKSDYENKCEELGRLI